ncbi:ATP-binding protein [Pseudoalteromonas sp. L23]|uniref:ATP-binding protein n=1 Tax=unclassified Pseudoalteromonas TaxID=194690 RepID=UPI001F3E322A|nr:MULTISPECIES: ATP-binding protein [unclassified Pseudoalteromonas]MCF7515630.1 ATP-binding protein [Pseudoalteromonas sp. L7]MCF7527715.1 ATP-binding protein [Pseudoalteromonas sp. L23]MCF2828561.1 ATP-binding protein [Pseudoalteromonas sp. OF5H-5]MCF2832726.1 ATP-binding protein [Pseudoalteromonas sp. DL2-H6]MCF2924835.1 ATP-binding protein [Pseudoalteromonas sp. DL2-H1]
MLKLLLSLYLAVFTSIVVINQVSEAIWSHWVHSAPDELRHAKAVANTLKASISSHNLPQESETVKILNMDDVAWLPEQAGTLVQGGILTSFDDEGSAWLTFKVPDSTLLMQLGPLAPAASAANKQWVIKLLSYAVLAFLLMLWIRPLWLDLLQLRYITENLTQGQLPKATRHSRFSAISNLTEQIRDLASQVARLIENQKLLVNAVSHDLRTPLARLKFALAMLPEQSREQANDMADDVVEMEAMIDEMLAYARLEFEVDKLEVTPLDLCALVDDQINKLRKLTDKQITLNKKSMQVIVSGNAHYLSRAIQNIVQNADKYGRSNIEISLECDKSNAYLHIEDDGDGIPKSQWESVFIPFSRLDESRSKDNGGYGLGLAIVRKIATWHRGSCHVGFSELGGAKFTLTLPRASS